MWYLGGDCEGEGEEEKEEAIEEESRWLSSLPAELQHIILTKLPGHSLPCACCCRLWTEEVLRIARRRLAGFQLTSPFPLISLRGVEQLMEAVGEQPSDEHAWYDEWPELRMCQASLLASFKGVDRLAAFTRQIDVLGGRSVVLQIFGRQGHASIASEIRNIYGGSVAWKVAAGWAQGDAEAVTLLASRGSAALASSLQQVHTGAPWHGEGASAAASASAAAPAAAATAAASSTSTAAPAPASVSSSAAADSGSLSDDTTSGPPAIPRFTASNWRLATALWRIAWRDAVAPPPGGAPRLHGVAAVAPLCYGHLDDEFGLITEDPSWEQLDRSRTIGGSGAVRFVTRGFGVACMVANANSFPDPSFGFHMPVRTGQEGITHYEPVESDLVAFISEPARDGACRSLIQTDDAVYRLPPFVEVTLVQVHEAGEWTVQGPCIGEIAEEVRCQPVKRRCYEVRVAF